MMKIQAIFTVGMMEVAPIIMVILMKIQDNLHHKNHHDSWRFLLTSSVYFVTREDM